MILGYFCKMFVPRSEGPPLPPNPFPNKQNQTSKLREFADDSFKFDENDRKFSNSDFGSPEHRVLSELF